MQALSGKDATKVNKKEKGQSSDSREELERKTVEEEDESLKPDVEEDEEGGKDIKAATTEEQ